MYKHLTIYYLSGTGNALKAATEIGAYAKSIGNQTDIISVDRQKTADSQHILKSDIIGLCYPTHGFSLPWHMLRFILSMPRVNKKHCFLLNTRAGSKLFNVHLPGISGIAQWLPLLVLWLKGYSIRGLLPLDMPSNWISIHPGFGSKTVSFITNRCMNLSKQFASILLSGKTYYRPIAFILIPLDIVLIPVSVGYMLAGRFFMAKTFVADYTCNNCGLCMQKCPVGAIQKKFNRPYWTIHCESCMRCMNICPEKSIQTAHGYVTLIVFALLYIPFFAIFSNAIKSFIQTHIPIIDYLTSITIFTILAIPFIVFSYELLAYLQKFKLSSWFFRYTSLTHYWRHYLAKDINANSFKKKQKCPVK